MLAIPSRLETFAVLSLLVARHNENLDGRYFTRREICEVTGFAAPRTSKILSRLQRDGFIRKIRNEGNRISWTVTENGLLSFEKSRLEEKSP